MPPHPAHLFEAVAACGTAARPQPGPAACDLGNADKTPEVSDRQSDLWMTRRLHIKIIL